MRLFTNISVFFYFANKSSITSTALY